MTVLQTFSFETASRFNPFVADRDVKQCDDEDLLQLVAQRDQSALRELVNRYNVRIFRFVLRMLDDRKRAEDVVNDTFLAIWRQAGSFEGRSSVATWMLAIARYKALSARTEARGLDEPLTEELSERLVDAQPGPEDDLSRRDQSAVIRRCINALPKHHSELLDMVYYHEKSVEEVAMIVGIPPNTVKSRMFLARRKLAELLIAQGVDRA